MSDTTKQVARAEREGRLATVPLAATAVAYKKGWIINIATTGYGKVGADASGERLAGIADQDVTVAAGGAAGDEKIQVKTKGWHSFDFESTLTQADLEMAAYVKSNYKLARVGDVSNSVFAGVIKELVSATKAWVDIQPAIPGLATLANAIS